ncbi:MAG: hypothetical protein J0H68_09335 [Sphingobacteriia bacterium]|nr:hypothetical protein [Sphingobacteriia bacterium]
MDRAFTVSEVKMRLSTIDRDISLVESNINKYKKLIENVISKYSKTFPHMYYGYEVSEKLLKLLEIDGSEEILKDLFYKVYGTGVINCILRLLLLNFKYKKDLAEFNELIKEIQEIKKLMQEPEEELEELLEEKEVLVYKAEYFKEHFPELYYSNKGISMKMSMIDS